MIHRWIHMFLATDAFVNVSRQLNPSLEHDMLYILCVIEFQFSIS